MALSQLREWAQDHQEKLELKVRSTSLSQVLAGYLDLSLSLSSEGKTGYGRGIAAAENEAYEKALLAALADLARQKTGKFTIAGSAESYARAAEAAKLKVAAQDLFLCHYLSQVPFFPVPLERFSEVPLYLKMPALTLARLGIRLEIREMRRASDFYTVIAIALGPGAEQPFGAVVGVSAGTTFLACIEQAMLECVGQIVELLEGRVERTVAAEAKPFEQLLSFPTPDQISRWVDPDRELEALPAFEISGREVLPEMAAWPFWLSEASTRSLQSYYPGIPSDEQINWDRLREFAGKELRRDEVCRVPHPLRAY